MTLFRQISLLTIVLIVVLLAGSLVVSVLNARYYLEKQLHSHAQDTATSLGLSISQFVQEKDWAKVNAMVDAIFDHGYFRSIVILGKKNEVVVDRQLVLQFAGVPEWFVTFINLKVPIGESLVMNGWRPQGRVRIESHPGYAYLDLWRNAQQAFLWFFTVGGVTLCLLLYLMRSILRPLKAVEAQAAAICDKDFSIQQPLPRTRELRRTVQAMNRMTYQLKAVFDEQVTLIKRVTAQAYKDPITGLGNELFFTSRFHAQLEAPEESTTGAVLVLKLNDLTRYNERYGRVEGDLLLKQISARWQKVLAEVQGSVIARRSGADFIAWLPDLAVDEAEYYLHAVYGSVTSLPIFTQREKKHYLNIGMAHCDLGDDESLLLENADAALIVSQSIGQNGVYVIQGSAERVEISNSHDEKTIEEKTIKESPRLPDHAMNLTTSEWRKRLEQALAQDEIMLFSQPVLSCMDSSVIYHEVFIRLEITGDLICAGVFMPLVDRFGLGVAYDKHIIEKLFLRISKEEALRNVCYCVNLSPHSLQAEGFVEWLLGTMRSYGRVASSIIFEVPERSLTFTPTKVRALTVGLRNCGSRVSVDHFGASNQSISYLGSLPLYAIKVDHSYIRDIENNSDHQFFVQSLQRIAHSRDIIVTAESVEREGQWLVLKDLGVDGAQGHFLGSPTAL